MSGVEVAALVAAVISAFTASMDLVRKYKRKKLQKRSAAQMAAIPVEESLAKGPPCIQSEYNRNFSLLGQRSAQGDVSLTSPVRLLCDTPRGKDNDYGRPRPLPPRLRTFHERTRGEGGEKNQSHRWRSEGRNSDSYNPPEDYDTPSNEESGGRSLSQNGERERKASNRNQLVTIGLASVTTVYMAYTVYQSMEGRKNLYDDVRYGEITPEEARRIRDKARIHDGIGIGIAALGIACAHGEWKEMKNQRDKVKAFDKEKGRC